MAEDNREELRELTKALKKVSGRVDSFTSTVMGGLQPASLLATWTDMVRIGKEQLLLDKGGESLAREMRRSGLTLGESFAQVGVAISTGFRQYSSGSKNLLTGITKLGLNERVFSNLLAYNTEILGMSLTSSEKLAKEIVTLGRSFHIDSNLIATSVQRMAETTTRISNQYGTGAGKGFQSALAYLTAAGGVQWQGAIQELMGIVAGSTAEQFSTGARFGVIGGAKGRGAGAYTEDAARLLSSIARTFESMLGGGGNINYIGDVLTKSFGISQEMLALAIANNRESIFTGELGADRFKQELFVQQKMDFVRAWNTMISTIQAEFVGVGLTWVEFITTNIKNTSLFVKDAVDSFKAEFNITDTTLSEASKFVFDTINKLYFEMLDLFRNGFPDAFGALHWAIDHSFTPAMKSLQAAGDKLNNIDLSRFTDVASGKISVVQALGGWDADLLDKQAKLSKMLGVTDATANWVTTGFGEQMGILISAIKEVGRTGGWRMAFGPAMASPEGLDTLIRIADAADFQTLLQKERIAQAARKELSKKVRGGGLWYKPR